MGDGTDNESDAGTAAAFEHADLDALNRLRPGNGEERHARGDSAGKDEEAAHGQNSG
jgi:hypothetical protein